MQQLWKQFFFAKEVQCLLEQAKLLFLKKGHSPILKSPPTPTAPAFHLRTRNKMFSIRDGDPMAMPPSSSSPLPYCVCSRWQRGRSEGKKPPWWLPGPPGEPNLFWHDSRKCWVVEDVRTQEERESPDGKGYSPIAGRGSTGPFSSQAGPGRMETFLMRILPQILLLREGREVAFRRSRNSFFGLFFEQGIYWGPSICYQGKPRFWGRGVLNGNR